jgi:thiamine-phosphate pyrophosphorylase
LTVFPSGRAVSWRARLDRARLYLCTDARERQGDLPEFLDTVLANGVDIVQLRQKGLEARQEIEYLSVFREVCDRHDALLAVNDRADVAYAVHPDVLHLGQDDLPVKLARGILGEDILIGRSTHSDDQAEAAAVEPGVDYFCAGPLWKTPTKEGRPAAGPKLIEYVAGHRVSRPWFAIGGIDLTNLDQVIEWGARRVVVVRAITEASDPGAAAADLSRRLHATSLTGSN